MSNNRLTTLSYTVSQARGNFGIFFEHNGGKVFIRTGRFHKDGDGGFMTEPEVKNETQLLLNNARKFRYINLSEHHTAETFQVFLLDSGTILHFPTNSAKPIMIDGVPHLESFDQVVKRLAFEQNLSLERSF